MANYLNIPLLNPFKFLPFSTSVELPGRHFDDDFSLSQILYSEVNAAYKQKWKRSETTRLQIESSVAPNDLQMIKWDPVTGITSLKTFEWDVVFDAISYKTYETIFDASTISDDQTFFLYLTITFGETFWEAITNPIQLADQWPGTKLFSYTHSENDYDVSFTATNIRFNFRAECEIPPRDLNTKREAIDYINDSRDLRLLSATPYRIFRLYVGDLNLCPGCIGVAPWVIDLLSRIFACDSVLIDNKQYAANSGADFEKSPIIGYPLVAAQLELVEGNNSSSLQFNDGDDGSPSEQRNIVIGYNIETGFFSTGESPSVPVIEIQENG